MFPLGIEIKKTAKELIINWQLTEVRIPIEEIVEFIEDDTYGGVDKTAVRIGTPYGTTDRIYIKTKKQNYLLYITNKFALMKKIKA